MLNIKKILFPSDFSECAECAYTHAAFLARKHNAELHVLNIQVMPYFEGESPEDYGQRAVVSELRQALEARMKALYQQRPEENFPIVLAQRSDTSADLAILDYAETHEIDLIVMGTHGRHGLEHFLMGSVAERVVRMAACPVLTIREAVVGHQVIKRILAPVDFSEFTLPTLLHAKALAELYDAELNVLHVIPESTLPIAYGMESLASGSTYDMRVTQKVLDERVKEMGETHVPVKTHVKFGYPVEQIVDFATADGPPDLIVISTHGQKGWKRFLMGSVSERVVRMANCPVFIARSFGKTLVMPIPNMEKREEAVA